MKMRIDKRATEQLIATINFLRTHGPALLAEGRDGGRDKRLYRIAQSLFDARKGGDWLMVSNAQQELLAIYDNTTPKESSNDR